MCDLLDCSMSFANSNMKYKPNSNTNTTINTNTMTNITDTTTYHKSTYATYLGVSLAAIIPTLSYTLYKYYQLQSYNINDPLPPYTIRVPNKSDHDAIAFQIHEAFATLARQTNPNQPIWSTPDIWTHFIDEYWVNKGGRCFIAVRNDTGEVMGSMFGDISDDIVGLGVFSVATRYSNGGLARTLIDKLLAQCRTDGRTKFALTQAASNYKSFALYTKIGLDIKIHVAVFVGYLSDNTTDTIHSDIVVHDLTSNDIDECDQLHIQCVGTSRINNMKNLLNKEYSEHALGVVARNKHTNEVLGYCTDVASGDGHWIYDTVQTFQALYLYANKRLRDDEHEYDRGVVVWMPHKFSDEIRWLLHNKLQVRTHFTVMYENHEFPNQTKYKYTPSAWY